MTMYKKYLKTSLFYSDDLSYIEKSIIKTFWNKKWTRNGHQFDPYVQYKNELLINKN